MWDKLKAFFANKTVIIVEAVLIALATVGLIEAGVKAESIIRIPELVAAVVTGLIAVITFIEGLTKDAKVSWYAAENSGINSFFKQKWVIITEAVIIALASAGLIIGGLSATSVVAQIVTLTGAALIGIEAIITFIQGLKA